MSTMDSYVHSHIDTHSAMKGLTQRGVSYCNSLNTDLKQPVTLDTFSRKRKSYLLDTNL